LHIASPRPNPLQRIVSLSWRCNAGICPGVWRPTRRPAPRAGKRAALARQDGGEGRLVARWCALRLRWRR
jgi:hypothetical protein